MVSRPLYLDWKQDGEKLGIKPCGKGKALKSVSSFVEVKTDAVGGRLLSNKKLKVSKRRYHHRPPHFDSSLFLVIVSLKVAQSLMV